jgi:hypothetical protein
MGESLEDVGTVADDEERRAVLFVEPVDQAEDVVAHVRVERCRGFIGDDERGATYDRLSNENPLALTAAQLVRVGLVDALGVVSQTDLVHHGERPLPHVLAIAPHVGAHDVADLRANGQYGIERERRLLEDDAHRNSTEYLALACGQRPEVASTNRDPARDRGFSRQETEQRQCHRRLAGAGRPGEAHDLATIDREAHVVQYAARCRAGGVANRKLIDG